MKIPLSLFSMWRPCRTRDGPMTLGEVIRLIRESAGESQRQMAHALGISNVHLCNLERGFALPSLTLMGVMFDVYGYCPYALVRLGDPRFSLKKHRAMLVRPGHPRPGRLTRAKPASA